MKLTRALVEAQRLKHGDRAEKGGKKPAADPSEITLAKAYDQFRTAHGPGSDKEHSPATRGWYEEKIGLHLGDWLDRSLVEMIEDHDGLVDRFLEIEARTSKSTASGVFRALRAITNHAGDGMRNPPRFPTRKIPWMPNDHRSRRDAGYAVDELPSVFRAILDQSDALRRCLYLTYALTGMRDNAVKTLLWSNCSPERLLVLNTKGRPFRCPTSPLIWSVAETARRISVERFGDEHDFVFATSSRNGEVISIQETKTAALPIPRAYAAWLADRGRNESRRQSPGIFRHTYADVADAARLTEVEIGELLNHSVGATRVTRGYKLSDLRDKPMPRRLLDNQQTVTEFILQSADFDDSVVLARLAEW